MLLGDALDTRPFRLDWPSGIVFYLIGTSEHTAARQGTGMAWLQWSHLPRSPTIQKIPALCARFDTIPVGTHQHVPHHSPTTHTLTAEAHTVAASALATASVQVLRGCLLRRVRSDGPVPLDFALRGAGYRGDRLSAWLLQRPGADADSLPQLLESAGELAAHGSLVFGEVPPAWSPTHALDVLARAGLLGMAESAAGVHGCMFYATQQRLSSQQAELFREHVSAAEAADEDFFGNFS